LIWMPCSCVFTIGRPGRTGCVDTTLAACKA
jgi:hypothetical protein